MLFFGLQIASDSVSENEIGLCLYHKVVLVLSVVPSEMSNVMAYQCQMSNVKGMQMSNVKGMSMSNVKGIAMSNVKGIAMSNVKCQGISVSNIECHGNCISMSNVKYHILYIKCRMPNQ